MKRHALLALVCIALLALVRAFVVIDDDLVHSLKSRSPEAARLFDAYHENSFFRGKAFIAMEQLAARDQDELLMLLTEAGYRETALFTPSPRALSSFVPLLPPEALEKALTAEALGQRAREVASWAAMPGSDVLLEHAISDPLGLQGAVANHFRSLEVQTTVPATAVRVFLSPSPLDYEKVGKVYDYLVARAPQAPFIGGDFFAYENYRAVQSDVVLCSILTLVLNLAIFYFFTGSWRLLLLLAVGSGLSWLTGVLAVSVFYPKVYAIVLAFTSTFVGFNNECLVHLSGCDLSRRKGAWLGIGSALGTTVIGFLVLLAGDSVIVRQMALASLGGLAGFLGCLYLYRRALVSVSFRVLEWPRLRVPAAAIVVVALLAALLAVALPLPRVVTNIEKFRFQSPTLEAQVAWFSQRLGSMSLDNMFAVKVEESPRATLSALVNAGVATDALHPLRFFRDAGAQRDSIDRLQSKYDEAVRELHRHWNEMGLALPIPPKPELEPVDERGFLEALGSLMPVKWFARANDTSYIFVQVTSQGLSSAEKLGMIPVSPKYYYDNTLTSLSYDLGTLFLVGLGGMVVFLALVQRSIVRVCYIFAPLLATAATGLALHTFWNFDLNIIHFMAFSLVIALALDYTSITVSARHGADERTKVLLTGMSTLATFGVLCFAKHPVLRDLGQTVAFGCALSLAFALLVEPRPRPFSALVPQEGSP